MIDIHTHLGRWGSRKEPEMTEDELLRRMDELGIAQAGVLPMGMTPECFIFPFDTDDVLAVHRRHPDRIIPFCNLDPRAGNWADMDFSWIFDEWRAAGCKGLGEVTANLPFDHPLCINLYRHCGRVGFPVLFHLADRAGPGSGTYGVADEMGLPRLEKTLRKLPQTTFIGHAPAFWNEIASNVNAAARNDCQDGPVAGPGRVPELLGKYPNLYGDLSAGSGFSAISRDPEFGYRFLQEHQDKLLFGTDICHVGQEAPLVPWLNAARDRGKISQACYDKIARLNARKLLGV